MHQETENLGTWWIRLKNKNCQPLKWFNSIVDLVLSLIIFGKLYIYPSTLHIIVILTLIYWMRSLQNMFPYGSLFWKKSSRTLSANVITYQLLNQTKFHGKSWSKLSMIIIYLTLIINITNACINLGHWPLHFKLSTSIIISKPNKSLYDSPKSFCPIVLLNMLSKLIEKVIKERIQFHTISNNFIHPHQFGGLQTSTLAFDITQFFPSLNHWLLSLVLDKVGFHSKVLTFFSDYWIGKKT